MDFSSCAHFLAVSAVVPASLYCFNCEAFGCGVSAFYILSQRILMKREDLSVLERGYHVFLRSFKTAVLISRLFECVWGELCGL